MASRRQNVAIKDANNASIAALAIADIEDFVADGRTAFMVDAEHKGAVAGQIEITDRRLRVRFGAA
jgi:hypothetical protein